MAILHKVVEVKPDYALARLALGRALLQQGDAAGAIENLEAAEKLDPNRDTTYFQLSQAYRVRPIVVLGAWLMPRKRSPPIKNSSRPTAANAARASRRINPDALHRQVPNSELFLLHLGRVSERIEELALAQKGYQRSLELNPKFIAALQALAHLLAGPLYKNLGQVTGVDFSSSNLLTSSFHFSGYLLVAYGFSRLE